MDIIKDSPKPSDLELDLETSPFIINKCKNSKIYCQNLYAAMCNNVFIKNDEEWSCSWRYSGGIIADLIGEGDYLDWYCSGIGSINNTSYASEGVVLSEIEQDLENLGWRIKDRSKQSSEDII
jgi:hypothetical protein